MNIEWLAGFIDAEGSLHTFNQRKSKIIRFSLGTTDYYTMNLVAKYLKIKLERRNPTGQAKSVSYHVRIQGVKAINKFINKIEKFVYTKYDCCLIMKRISSIMEKHVDNPAYRYSEVDKLELDRLSKELSYLNFTKLSSFKKRKFSWAWFAGLIDGDGSIHVSTFSKSKRDGGTKYLKPVIKISMNDEFTVEYIANYFNRPYSKYTPKNENKRPTYTVRFLSRDIPNILLNIRPYSITKAEQIELLNRFMLLKSSNDNTGRNNHELREIRNEIISING